jgi:tetratricopeptide (TPR) repeat protein
MRLPLRSSRIGIGVFIGPMRLTITLDNLYKRFAAILAVTGIGLGLGWTVVSNFIVRAVEDNRLSFRREWLTAAVERFPNSARINFQLAKIEIAEGAHNGRYDAQAESHAGRAVNLSPWDYQARSLLATAQELNGKREEAENSLRAAVKLAPNHAELNWVFANLLLRRGKLAESFGPFRVATRSRPDLLKSAIESIWRSSDGGVDALTSFARYDAEAMLAVVKFLTEQNLVAEAGAVFNSIDKQAKAHSPQSPELIGVLMRAGQFDFARAAWVELMTVVRPDAREAGSLIWDGGFEMDAVEGLNQFNWAIRPNKFAWVAIDRSVARTGSRSLKVVFSGLDTTTLSDQVQQTMVLKPGASYYLECYAKAKDLITPEGPRIAVIGPSGLIGESGPASADSNGWEKLTISFIAPANQPAATLAIVRTPRFSYDDPTKGTIWFDDFTLVER